MQGLQFHVGFSRLHAGSPGEAFGPGTPTASQGTPLLTATSNRPALLGTCSDSRSALFRFRDPPQKTGVCLTSRRGCGGAPATSVVMAMMASAETCSTTRPFWPRLKSTSSTPGRRLGPRSLLRAPRTRASHVRCSQFFRLDPQEVDCRCLGTAFVRSGGRAPIASHWGSSRGYSRSRIMCRSPVLRAPR